MNTFSPRIANPTPMFTAGAYLLDDDGNGWNYCQATEACTAHYVAAWIDAYEAKMIDDDLSVALHHSFHAGVPVVAVPLNQFGWFQVYGAGVWRAASGYAIGGFPYTTDDKGELDDASSGHHRVRRIVGYEAGEGLVRGMFNFPGGSQDV